MTYYITFFGETVVFLAAAKKAIELSGWMSANGSYVVGGLLGRYAEWKFTERAIVC